MVEADSFNNLGGKLSQPVDLVDLSDLSCLSTPKMEIYDIGHSIDGDVMLSW